MTKATRISENLDAILHAVRWVDANSADYQRKYREYVRGGLPSQSMSDGLHGSGDPPMPGFDDLDREFRDRHLDIAACLLRARNDIEKAARMMRATNELAPPMEDPTPQACSNVQCPDGKVFSMIGTDRPHSQKEPRCEPCRKVFERKGVERTMRRGVTV